MAVTTAIYGLASCARALHADMQVAMKKAKAAKPKKATAKASSKAKKPKS